MSLIPVDTVKRVVNQIICFGKTVRPTLGITVLSDAVVKALEQQYGRGLQGVLIADILPNSPAVVAGLEATRRESDGSIVLGDLISRVDGKAVKQTEDLISAIEEKQDGDMVELVVWRKGDPRRVETIKVRLTTRDKLDQQQRQPTPSKDRRSSTSSRAPRYSGQSRTRTMMRTGIPFFEPWQ